MASTGFVAVLNRPEGGIAALGKGITKDFLGHPVKEGDRAIVSPAMPTTTLPAVTPSKCTATIREQRFLRPSCLRRSPFLAKQSSVI
jgi:hypothetical protein